MVIHIFVLNIKVYYGLTTFALHQDSSCSSIVRLLLKMVNVTETFALFFLLSSRL